MNRAFINASVFRDGAFKTSPVVIEGEMLSSSVPGSAVQRDCHSYFILPGFADVHVHLREPGFSYKETILSGTRASARGGYTTVCAMPNLNPVPDSEEHIRQQLEKINRDACVEVLPYAAITVGEKGEVLSDMEALAGHCVAFSDDGKGVQSREKMREAMLRVKRLGKIIAAHCEDESLLHGGYINDGEYARKHGHAGICAESEWGPIKRDLELVRETGCAYHVCHISTKESVELIRRAKAEGLDVSCETAPHYLLLDDGDLQEDGRFKMNPPLRSKADKMALIEGICDGTIDMIATDHAPHSAEEKSRGLKDSPMGIVGLETAFPLLYTYMVKPGIISLERLIDLMCRAPRRRFGLGGGELEPGCAADFTVFDLNAEYEINPEEFCSMGRSTPFAGWKVAGRCLLTVSRGKIAWSDGTIEEKTN